MIFKSIFLWFNLHKRSVGNGKIWNMYCKEKYKKYQHLLKISLFNVNICFCFFVNFLQPGKKYKEKIGEALPPALQRSTSNKQTIARNLSFIVSIYFAVDLFAHNENLLQSFCWSPNLALNKVALIAQTLFIIADETKIYF